MRNRPIHYLRNIDRYLIILYDLFLDICICQRSLVKQIPSISENTSDGTGSTPTQSTPYVVLKKIFTDFTITENDAFIDVGCGKGRVLAYLVAKNAPCVINGVEFNPVPAEIAKSWSSRYGNVNVIIADAFDIDYNQYTIIYMNRPFLPVTFKHFIELLENQLSHPIRLIYWVDQQSGHLLRNRAGWKMLHREAVFKVHSLRVAYSPQGFSIWSYEPSEL